MSDESIITGGGILGGAMVVVWQIQMCNIEHGKMDNTWLAY